MDTSYRDIPEGLNVLVRCERTNTGTVLILKVPPHITPNDFPDWCVDDVPLGFHPCEIIMATDEQCKAMEY